MNPYESPTAVVEPTDDPESTPEPTHPWLQNPLIATLGLRVMATGLGILLFCVAVMFGGLLLRLQVRPPTDAGRIVLNSVRIALPVGLTLNCLGMMIWMGFSPRRKFVGPISLFLSVVGSLAFFSFIERMPRIGFLPPGLLPLFGAASYAMLLTGLALNSYLLAGWSTVQNREDVLRWSSLAIIGYAVSACLASAVALKVIPGAFQGDMIWYLATIFLSSGLVLHMLCVRAVIANRAR